MTNESYGGPILVTGAAGRIGGVGRDLVGLLRAEGHAVRAHVRVEDDRAARLRDLGAEITVGDLLDPTVASHAVEGCARVCFTMSVAASYLEVAANLAVAAKHHGVKAFVNLSQMTVREMDILHSTESPQQRQHWLVEQILAWSGTPVVEVRPTSFMEGLFLPNARGVATQDALLAPFGPGKTSPIAGIDVARVLLRILVAPEPHLGKTYHLTGPVSQDMDGVARELYDALGRTIRYVDVPFDAWKAQLASSGLPPHVTAHVETMAKLHKENRYDRFSDDVEAITGSPPMTIREFVRKNAAIFRGSAPPMPST